MLSIDTETTGFSWYDDAFLVTVADASGSWVYDLDSNDESADCCEHILSSDRWIFHNAKFDLQKLLRAELIGREHITPERIEDTDIIAHLLNPTQTTKLKHLARTVLGKETDEATAITKAKKELQKQYKVDTGKTLLSADIGYHLLPRDILIPYALKDAEFTWELWHALKPQLHDTLVPLYAREIELTTVLLDIEANGMRVDMDYVDREIKKLNGQILSRELRISDMTGLKVWYPEKQGQKTPEGCFNPGSTQQLQAVFAEKGIELANTQEVTLALINDPLAGEIVDLRKDKKLLVTYLLNMKNDQREGIIHPRYSNKPKTGRMSSAAYSGD